MKLRVKTKQLLDKLAIDFGLRNPGSKNRHDWVVSGLHDQSHHDNNRRFQIDFLQSQGLSPEHELLEIGCGTLRGGVPIIEYLNKGNYYGIDVRKGVLTEARKELADHNLENKNPHIMLLELAKEQLQISVDVIWSFQVLLHMDESKLKEAFKFAAKCLAKEGSFYATVFLGDFEEQEWQGFPVISRTLEVYETEARNVGLEMEPIGTLESLRYIEYVTQEKSAATTMLRITHKA